MLLFSLLLLLLLPCSCLPYFSSRHCTCCLHYFSSCVHVVVVVARFHFFLSFPRPCLSALIIHSSTPRPCCPSGFLCSHCLGSRSLRLTPDGPTLPLTCHISLAIIILLPNLAVNFSTAAATAVSWRPTVGRVGFIHVWKWLSVHHINQLFVYSPWE